MRKKEPGWDVPRSLSDVGGREREMITSGAPSLVAVSLGSFVSEKRGRGR